MPILDYFVQNDSSTGPCSGMPDSIVFLVALILVARFSNLGLDSALCHIQSAEGESLTELLTRLDLAIARAHTEDIFTDEINPANAKRP
jgi:hypothetical protein